MNIKYIKILFYTISLICLASLALSYNILCYYDASSIDRKGIAHFSLADLENSLEFCSHVLYGYARLNTLTFRIEHGLHRQHFQNVTSFKAKYPQIKFLLSVGGGRDLDLSESNIYLRLLEADPETKNTFINSVVYLLRSNKFDGLDLAFQFPSTVNNPQTEPLASEKSLRKLITGNLNETKIQEKDYKTYFLDLVQKLRNALTPHDLMLSLTVPPNINASLYFNGSELIKHLNFINLQTFDFITPSTSPTEATYTAPLYPLPQKGSAIHQNTVYYQVRYWISQRIPLNKINVGIAAYGRAWSLTNDSYTDGFPKLTAAKGPAPESYVTNLPGILTWTEICPMLLNALNVNKTGPQAPLLSVLDPHWDFVTYAFRPPDANGEHGMWISYDDPRIAAIKAAYVRNRGLGGVALFDVSLDDFHGVCNGETFPMLRYIKYTFW